MKKYIVPQTSTADVQFRPVMVLEISNTLGDGNQLTKQRDADHDDADDTTGWPDGLW